MKSFKKWKLLIINLVAILCLIMVWYFFSLWIKAYDLGSSQEERVSIYLKNFPSFLGLYGITLIEILICSAIITINIINFKQNDLFGKFINITISVVAGIKLLLTLFMLM